MGWCSGGELFAKVWGSVRDHLHPGDLERVCKEIIDAFEDMDCDTIAESVSGDWPEVAFCIYLNNMNYFEELCWRWDEDESTVPIHQYLNIAKSQYETLIEMNKK